MANLLDPQLEKTFVIDKAYLQETKLPIVTVSASTQEDIKGMHGLPENELIRDIVFSRAHYSMAAGIAVTAWGKAGDDVDHTKAWVVDPTNYVSAKNWKSIQFTEVVGKTLARNPLLKKVKDVIDSFGRSKLPILSSIAPPLLHLTQHVDRPILSLHIAAGNILTQQGKTVVQVVTDPHVRDEYLNNAGRSNYYLCVFDEKTKTDVFEKAEILGKKIDPARVIVTGPPIDPRIIKARSHKHAWRSGPLKLCITTGGLGTNTYEIRKLLLELLPQLRKRPSPYQVLLYAGTHKDISAMVNKLAAEHRVKVGKPEETKEELRLLYHPQIVDANELLIKYGFPWADGFVSKPSGDMAYDAVAAGCFLLTLQEWGEWEFNIREIFEQLGVARKAEIDHFAQQLTALTTTRGKAHSWVEKAMNHAHSIDKLFLQGSEKIIEVVERVGQQR